MSNKQQTVSNNSQMRTSTHTTNLFTAKSPAPIPTLPDINFNGNTAYIPMSQVPLGHRKASAPSNVTPKPNTFKRTNENQPQYSNTKIPQNEVQQYPHTANLRRLTVSQPTSPMQNTSQNYSPYQPTTSTPTHIQSPTKIIFPHPSDVLNIQLYLNQANEYIHQGNYLEAENIITRGLTIPGCKDTEKAELYNELAFSYSRQAKHDETLKAVAIGLGLPNCNDETKTRLYLAQAYAFNSQLNYTQALNAVAEALKISDCQNTIKIELYTQQAFAYDAQENHPESQNSINEALKIPNTNDILYTELYNVLSCSYFKQGAKPQALVTCFNALYYSKRANNDIIKSKILNDLKDFGSPRDIFLQLAEMMKPQESPPSNHTSIRDLILAIRLSLELIEESEIH